MNILESVNNIKDKELVECIANGFNTIFEGWMDVRPDPDSIESMDALTRFNMNAGKYCQSLGSPIVSRLNEFERKNKSIYQTEDEDARLDTIQTNDFLDDYIKKFKPVKNGSDFGIYAAKGIGY